MFYSCMNHLYYQDHCHYVVCSVGECIRALVLCQTLRNYLKSVPPKLSIGYRLPPWKVDFRAKLKRDFTTGHQRAINYAISLHNNNTNNSFDFQPNRLK